MSEFSLGVSYATLTGAAAAMEDAARCFSRTGPDGEMRVSVGRLIDRMRRALSEIETAANPEPVDTKSTHLEFNA